MERLKISGIYKHFKGNVYKVLMIAENSETCEEMVVYQAMYGDGKVYVRPLEMFLSPVDRNKYPDASQEYRFELQENSVDPGLMDFLDADSTEDKLSVLSKLHARITNDMIDVMATSMDFMISSSDNIEERFEELRKCIETRAMYEGTRLRS